MRFIDKTAVRRYQQGGPMPAGDPAMAGAPVEAAPAPAQGGQDQMMAQLEQMAMEIVNQLGPDASAMLAEMIMAMLQQGGAPAEGAQPVFRKGGKMKRKGARRC
jgi:hypothetical protein